MPVFSHPADAHVCAIDYVMLINGLHGGLKVSVHEDHRRTHRWGKKGIFLPMEIGSKNQKFLENLKSPALFRSIYLFLAMAVYLPA